ncbi:hypothetical protein CY35_01G124900 [Sphagnum magellanicum]|jgi:hypothetical protein|nr:hypothetical protein CY35_01G124900 [Sphagnum magellanicum]
MSRAGCLVALLAAVMVWCMIGTTAAAPPDCSVEFSSLTSCIAYVQGTDPTPAASCCTAFSSVRTNSPVCLCELLQQFQNPNSGLGNITRAMDISTLCKVNADASRCASLLGAPAPAIAPPVVAPALPPVSEGPTGADVDCSTPITELQACLPYVQISTGPPPALPAACCTALSSVQQSKPVCLCELLSQLNNSAQFGINGTKALGLPKDCNVDANYNECPALLGSPVSSPAAAVAPATSPGPVGAAVPPSSPAAAASGVTLSSAPAPSTHKPSSGPASNHFRPSSQAMLVLIAGALLGLEALVHVL